MSRMLFQTAFKSIRLCLCSHAAGTEETPHGLDNRGGLRSPDTLIGKENHISAISDASYVILRQTAMHDGPRMQCKASICYSSVCHGRFCSALYWMKLAEEISDRYTKGLTRHIYSE